MTFELTEALIDDILFSMEDQEGEFYVDAQEGMVTGGEGEFLEDIDYGDKDRYLPLPEWDSSDGFRLMERFAAQLRNPIVREELSAALNLGKGVFRAFKDILSRHPEAEKLWYNFKEREMKREIIRWYNALREEWGLERIGGEPEETEDLILEDFRFREPLEKDTKAAAELHRLCAEDQDGWAFPGDLAITAETIGGDFAGYVAGRRGASSFRVYALEVKPEYRGLGVGEALISRFLDRIKDEEPASISIDLPTGAEGFSRALLRNSFQVSSVRYVRTGMSGAT
jgi:ribosomal protein S18 acetylase RimI-like enzyme